MTKVRMFYFTRAKKDRYYDYDHEYQLPDGWIPFKIEHTHQGGTWKTEIYVWAYKE